MPVEYPLTNAHRLRLAEAFRSVPRVDIAIDCAIEGQMGWSLVDDERKPTVFAIRIGPFCYLAGDPKGEGGRQLLTALTGPLMIMAAAPGWIEAVRAARGERVTTYERFSYSSEQLSRGHLSTLLARSVWSDHIAPMGHEVAEETWAGSEVADIRTFDSAADFVGRGFGYCVQDSGVTVGAAYSSLVCSHAIEVSVFVEQGRRKQGMATALSAALLVECLSKGLHPNWDAANEPSCRLAEKLGYLHTGSYLEHYLTP